MTFTAPFTAVPGEVITAAGWNTSARDNINHIWGVLGGNPGTNNLVPVSTGASASSWQKVPDAALFDQKVSQTALAMADANTNAVGGLYYMTNLHVNGPVAGHLYHIINTRYTLDTGYRAQIAIDVSTSAEIYVRTIIGGTPGPWNKLWTASGDGTGSGLDADVLRGLIPGNASGNIPISNGTMSVGLNAQFLQGLVTGNGSGSVPISNGTMNVALNAALLQGLIPGNASGNIPISNGVVNTNFVAANSNALAGSSWFTPLQINASGSDAAVGAGINDMAGLSWTCTRTGTYRVSAHAMTDNTGITAGAFDKALRLRNSTTSAVYITRSMFLVTSGGTFGGNRSIGIAEWIIPLIAGQVIQLQTWNYGGSVESVTINAESYMTVEWYS